MKPNGTELSVYNQQNRFAIFCVGLVFAALVILLIKMMWIDDLGPDLNHSGSGRHTGPTEYLFLKYLGVPFLSLLTLFFFRGAFSGPKTTELRVGEHGIWRRPLFGNDVFIPWNEVREISIFRGRMDFLVKDIKKYPSLWLGHQGVYLTRKSSPIPLRELAEKFSRYPQFAERYKPTDPKLP